MGGGQTGSSNQATTNTPNPVLQPLYANTAGLVQGAQYQLPGFGTFMGSNPQQIPGLTEGQMSVLGQLAGRTQGSPFNAYDVAGTGYAQGQGNLNNPQNAALGAVPGISNLNTPEYSALNAAPGFSALTTPEQQAMQQIGYFAGGPIGSSPATQQAMAAARTPALQDLAAAGLGNSDAVQTSLTGAYAPILAQEMAIRAGVIPQLANMGASQRGGAEAGAALQSQIGQALRGGQLSGAGLESQIGQQLQGGQQFAANYLGQQGSQYDTRTGANLAAYGTAEEQNRQIAAQQQQANYNDFLRQQGLYGQYTTGILSGMPNLSSQNVVGKTTTTGK